MQAYLIFRRVPTSHLLVRSQQGRSFALAASICQRADREECLYREIPVMIPGNEPAHASQR